MRITALIAQAGGGLGTCTEFARAVARRYRPWKLALAALSLVALVFFGSMGIMTAIWDAPPGVKEAALIEVTVMGLFIAVAVAAADEAVERGTPRAATYAIAVILAAATGAVVGWEVRMLLGVRYPQPPGLNVELPHPHLARLTMAIVGTLVAGLATFVHVNRSTALAARRRQHEAELARARARRRTLESQLQALQARVEPMFLFDTLEHIRKLYRVDAAAASHMLEDLIVYLRAALPHLRESSSSAGQELTLARSWLDIVGRSATNWHVDIEVDDAARAARVPALVLLPLVQCAAADAGAAGLRLRMAVRVDARRLRIDVCTSTGAFADGVAGRPMLEQIGERLHALYADDARFESHRGDGPAGSQARIDLPLERGDVEDTRGTS